MCYPLLTSTSEFIYIQNYKMVENSTPFMYNSFLFKSEIKHLYSLLTKIYVGNQMIWKKSEKLQKLKITAQYLTLVSK